MSKLRDYSQVPPEGRRVILVISQEKAKQIKKTIKWATVPEVTTSIGGLASAGAVAGIPPIGGMLLLNTVWMITWMAIRVSLGIPLKNNRVIPFPAYPPKAAKKFFDFPPNHPNDGVLYACCDRVPAEYVPFAQYHRYMYELKMSAFQEMCSNLGAKKCSVIREEMVSSKGSAGVGGAKAGVSGKMSGSYERSSSQDARILFTMPKPTAPLCETKTSWKVGEPTWVRMEKTRLERGLDTAEVEFSYTDEMGVTAEVAAKIQGIGLNLGGKFEKAKRLHWLCQVEFWPETE